MFAIHPEVGGLVLLGVVEDCHVKALTLAS